MSNRAPLHLDIDFVTFQLFEHYLIATVQEGVILEAKEMQKFHEVFNEHYSGRPFGCISDRRFDYTINPIIYQELDDAPFNLVGVATLCYSTASYNMAKFTGKFFDYPHEAFYSQEECIDYINDLLVKNKKAGL